MNKKQKHIYEQWVKSNRLNLNDCYKSPSDAKLEAEQAVINACLKMHGRRFRILSYNKYTFTCAYALENNGKTMLVWHSPYYTEAFEVPTDEKG